MNNSINNQAGEKHLKGSGYTLIICKMCEAKRYVEAKQYPNGLPDTCIKCSRGG